MKKILFSLCLLLGAQAAFSQYWVLPNPNAGTNPGSLNSDDEYPVGGGLPAGWVTVLAGGNTNPVWSTAQTIPFTFSFDGSAATQFKVSSSGILTFDVASSVAAPSYTKSTLPSAAIPDKSVCIWGMGGIGTNDNVISKTFGSAPNRQLWIQFSSFGYGTTASDGSNFTYWSIVLEEGTNNIHIVDNRTGGYSGNANVFAGIQLNASTAINVQATNLNALAGTDPTPADNSYYTFVSGTQPAYDLTATEITTNQYLAAGNVNVAGKLRNLGSTTITSLDINYKIDGGATVTSTLSGLNIASLATYTFTHPTPWNATVGNHTVEVWATNLNGSNPDANTANDKKTKTIQVMSENVVRIPLFEIFTSSTCGPCKPGNEQYHSVVDSIPETEFASLKYQQDFPGTGDPYTTVETKNRRSTYYGINSIPRMEIDGGWDNNASSFTVPIYNASKAIPAQFKMNGHFVQNNNNFVATVSFSPLINSTGAKLYMAIYERRTIKNVKSNGETEFFNVVKKMLPNETGTALPAVTIGNWDSITSSYTFPGNFRLPTDGQTANIINLATENSVENFFNLGMIAWIQAPDKSVLQACHLSSNIPAGTSSITNTMNNVTVYPNPASKTTTIDFNLDMAQEILYTLVDMNGDVIVTNSVKGTQGKNSISINVENLANGIYNVMLFDTKGNSHVEQVVIAH
ncbi:MAG: T9SS type A sorting domain-containing protein [Chitinophagaceae bacterium]|nr:T9SS type A sorting domain-containing protein [Chitinophagaceae bacterium]